MKRLIQAGCVGAVLALVAACSDSLTTGPSTPIGPSARASTTVVPQTPVCSAAGIPVQTHPGTAPAAFSGFQPAVAPAPNPFWAAAITGSVWITPNDADGNGPYTATNAPDFVTSHYQVSFTVPANSGASLAGTSYADNAISQILLDNAGSSLGANADLNDDANYHSTALSYSTSSGLTAGSHTLDFYVQNNNHVTGTNPTGLDFCFTVSITPPVTTTWCSPGYWKNHHTSPPWPAGYLTLGYNTFSAQYVRDPKTIAGNPSLYTVVSNPSTYKGPATNNVADAISNFLFGTPFGRGIESCPLS